MARRHRGSGLSVQHGTEGKHLAEAAGGVGQGERRAGHQVALAARKHLMHAMSELVRQCHHVARAAMDQFTRQVGCALKVRLGWANPPPDLPGRNSASIHGAVEEADRHGGEFRR